MARQPNYNLASMSSAVHAVAEVGSLERFSSVALLGVEVHILIRQPAPGMVEQMQSVCSYCNGGEGINGKGRCRKCEGKTVIKEVKILCPRRQRHETWTENDIDWGSRPGPGSGTRRHCSFATRKRA